MLAHLGVETVLCASAGVGTRRETHLPVTALERIVQDFEVVGERTNKLVGYLAAV